MRDPQTNPPAGEKTVAVIGAGLIGSHLLPHLARMPRVGRVTIVDHDVYEEGNLVSQDIAPADVGGTKAIVQGARIAAIAPHLRVRPIVERVENVPCGVLRADVLCGCLDSRAARGVANRMAWRLGIPFVDAGVQADGLLARIHVYLPGADRACYECQGGAAEEQRYACDGAPLAAPASGAPGSLGALAAAMQAIEVRKILDGEWERVAVSREVLIDARFHRHFVTRLPRNPACGFDHRTLTVRTLAGELAALTLGDLFTSPAAVVRVGEQRFAKRWACPSCHAELSAFGLRDRLAASLVCPACKRGMRAIGFDTLERIAAADVPAGLLSAPLASLGFRVGDIIGITTNADELYLELTGANAVTHA